MSTATRSKRRALNIQLRNVAADVVEKRNCLRVQAEINRTGQARGGTCWWDDRTERLLKTLPADACWVCRLREAVKQVDALSVDQGSASEET